MVRVPAWRKSAMLRVTMVRPCAKAVAAIRLSFTDIASPFFFSVANSAAQAEAESASKSSTCKPPDTLGEPFLKPPAALSGREQQDTVFQFPQDNWVDGDLRFLSPQPLDNPIFGRWFGHLAQDVGVNEEFHGEWNLTTSPWILTRSAGTNPFRGRPATNR